MLIAVPDLITNSFFPALAAEELGFFAGEGLDAHVDLLMPGTGSVAALRDGEADCLVTGVHTVPTSFPGFAGVKIAVAVSQGTPWLLVLRTDLGAQPGDLGAVKGRRIAAAPGPDTALLRVLALGGIDVERDRVQIVRVPGAEQRGASFGVMAAEALASGEIDGFWANGLGTETAVRRGVGQIVVDVRRGDGPPAAGRLTFAGLVTTDAMLAREPDRIAAAVRAIVKAQRALRADPRRAAEVGRRRFPPAAAEMIATVVARDVSFYDPVIHEDAVSTMSDFACALGLLAAPVAYERIVATQFRPLWTAESDR